LLGSYSPLTMFVESKNPTILLARDLHSCSHHVCNHSVHLNCFLFFYQICDELFGTMVQTLKLSLTRIMRNPHVKQIWRNYHGAPKNCSRNVYDFFFTSRYTFKTVCFAISILFTSFLWVEVTFETIYFEGLSVFIDFIVYYSCIR